MNPLTASLDAGRRGWLRAADLVERGVAAPEGLARAADVEVGTTPSEVVYTENKLTLRRYAAPDRRHETPILLVYALINRPYVLDLQPDRSVVRTLLDGGFDVYLIDWGEPSTLDATLSLADYVERYLDNCVAATRADAGVDAVHLLGYCMGGTMSAMYAARHPERVRTLGLLAAGLYFDETGGVLERWGDGDYYDPGAVAATYGTVPAEFLDAGFALLDPVENLVTKYVRLFENLDDGEFVENFARMETWLDDGIDVAGETYREFLEDIYQENRLARGEMRLDGEAIDLDRIAMPVLQIVGEYDTLIPPESSVPFNDVIGSEDTTVISFPTGHIGLSVSSRSHAELWPRVCEWFAARSDDDDDADDAASESETGDDGGRDLEAVPGIGPAYAARLRAAGIADPAALAAANAGELAVRPDAAPGRVANWIAAASDLVADAAEDE